MKLNEKSMKRQKKAMKKLMGFIKKEIFQEGKHQTCEKNHYKTVNESGGDIMKERMSVADKEGEKSEETSKDDMKVIGRWTNDMESTVGEGNDELMMLRNNLEILQKECDLKVQTVSYNIILISSYVQN